MASVPGFDFTHENHAANLLKGIQDMKFQRKFFDVVICVGEHEFPCHRVVVASCSTYFQALFSHDLKNQTRVSLHEVDPTSLGLIIEFMYTSKLTLTDDNVQSLLETSDLIQVLEIKNACATYLERQIDFTNCLGIQQFAELHTCQALSKKAKMFIMENFSEVSKEEELLALPKDSLLVYLSSDNVQVRREEDILEAVLAWSHQEEAREQILFKLLNFVRFMFIDEKYLEEKIQTHEALKRWDGLNDMLKKVKQYRTMTATELSSIPCCQSRVFSEIVVILGGNVVGHECQVQVYDPKTRKWSSLPELPLHKDQVATAVSLGNNIFVSSRRGKSLLYKWQQKKWLHKSSPLLKGRWSQRCVVLDGWVYALGGKDVNWASVTSVEKYNPAKNTWTETTPMIHTARKPGVTVCHGKIYVIGGYSDVNPPPSQCYDPLLDQWSIVSSCPTLTAQQPACTAVTLNGAIYVICDVTGVLYCYDPLIDSWQLKSPQIVGRTDPGMTVCNGRIYVFGGYYQSNLGAVETIETYDVVDDTWTTVGYMPVAVYRHGCVTIRRLGH
ncbi:kelch-like protein 24 [Saccoglossus kowalevskii]|uniref:Kelch-like protein 24-like n=1 Tax=Saccoglossus kowalevskii TaxID=10224 RepID=A0ABM0GMI6_SACKO|nr:PREDICTED: kelch-like protein 24-like [Saccoglossus kowalevskii]